MPFIYNPAATVYGNKTIKTNIVGSNCNCPITPNNNNNNNNNTSIYKILVGPLFFNNQLLFKVGDDVYAKNVAGYYAHAVVVEIVGQVYTILFDDGTKNKTTNNNLLVYFACECNPSTVDENIVTIGSVGTIANDLSVCYIVNEYLGVTGQVNTLNYIKGLLPMQFQNILSTYYS